MNLLPFLQLASEGADVETLKSIARYRPEFTFIYPDSIHLSQDTLVFMAKDEQAGKKLIAFGSGSPLFAELAGAVRKVAGLAYRECDLSPENSEIIRSYFPFTNPQPVLDYKTTIGLGDRLGIASPGQLRLLKGLPVRPVLAQQSIRELNLTGRDYRQVLADAVWAVFQENYHDGFGADGDHLKNAAEVKMALEQGFTMITLDCSEHIHGFPENRAEIEQAYQQLDPAKRSVLEERFLEKEFLINNQFSLRFSLEDLQQAAVIYQEAIDFSIKLYQEVIAPVAFRVDFEVSIDETMTATTPEAHFFVGLQLVESSVKVSSLAPRFCGEFQKGIDYRGDLTEFKEQFQEHLGIARHFGYKLSIHSGSDKFSVFPIIGQESQGNFHLKTAGTNWLEAVRVILAQEPQLFREIYRFAQENLAEAKKYYHVSVTGSDLPSIVAMPDRSLPVLLENDDTRQLLHITYGLILQARNVDGSFCFRDRIFQCLSRNEALYYTFLERHIGKHLELLGVKIKQKHGV